jgi:hypothetical protein
MVFIWIHSCPGCEPLSTRAPATPNGKSIRLSIPPFDYKIIRMAAVQQKISAEVPTGEN